jgi:hypothetical protein
MADPLSLISSGIGVLGGLFGGGPSDEELAAAEELRRARQRYESMPGYTPPALDYNPAAYGAPETPEGQIVTEDPNIRNAQIAALNSLLTRSNEGLTAEERRAQDLSRRKQEETTQGAEESIINNMMARGVGGSGMEYALRQNAAQRAADTASQGGLAREATNADQKLAALNSLMAGESSLRGQDYTVNKGNTDILNNFAQENSRRRNAINAQNTELANQAQLKNKEAGREDYTTAYNADVAKRRALAGMDEKQSNFDLGQDATRRGEERNLWGNVGNLAGGIYNYATQPSSTSSGTVPTTSSNSDDYLKKNKQWFNNAFA